MSEDRKEPIPLFPDRAESEPPQEQTQQKGTQPQFLTINLRRSEHRAEEILPRRNIQLDREEGELEAMLEANSKRSDRQIETITESAPQPEQPPQAPLDVQAQQPSAQPERQDVELAPQPEPPEDEKIEEKEAEEHEALEDEASQDNPDEGSSQGGSDLTRRFAAWMERRRTKQAQRRSLPGEEPEQAAASVKPAAKSRASENNVIPMPEEKPSLLQKKLDAWREKADDFAGTMFRHDSEEEEEEEAVYQEVERLIPGTDEERRPQRHIQRDRQEKKQKEVHRAPDTSPKELYRIFGASYKSGHSRLPFQFALAVLLLAVTAIAGQEFSVISVPFLTQNLRITGLILVLGLGAAAAIGLDTLLEGIVRLFRGRPGLNTLSSIGVVLAIVDGLWYALLSREGPLPFCGFAALSLWAVSWGNCCKKRGLRDACEDAYTRNQFERLTMDEGKWNGKGVFVKVPGTAKGFGSQIQEPDGAERVYRYATPVMIAACFLFGILSVVGQKQPQQLIWSWSVIFVLATPLSATLAYGLPYARLVKRLHRSGAVLAGWEGIASMDGDAGIVLTDRDLFPDGSVQFTGIRNFGDVSLEKLTGCTASMIREADVGLAKIFDDQVRIQGGFYRRVDELNWKDEGGFTGLIRGDQVMVGSSGYLQVHGVQMDAGYQTRNAVFCAINGRLQGNFALSYSLPRTVKPTIQTLLGSGIHPILATRDFNITPDVLRQKFRLPSDRMLYPAVDRRHELSDRDQPHSPVLGALLFREGIGPFADVIMGGRRMKAVVRLNTLLTVAASVVGALLGLYLTMMSAYSSLSPMNILFFLIMWLIPTLLVSRGVDQF